MIPSGVFIEGEWTLTKRLYVNPSPVHYILLYHIAIFLLCFLVSQRYSSVPFYSLFLAKLGMKTPVEQYGFYASCAVSGYLGGRFALHHYRMLRGAFLNDEAAQKLGI